MISSRRWRRRHASLDFKAQMADGRFLRDTCTSRLNRRRKLFGHVFSGRYKALLVEARRPGSLKTVGDYVHLNPVRARFLGAEERLLSYPWSSFAWYWTAPAHRPSWIRVDRWLACIFPPGQGTRPTGMGRATL